MYCKGKVDNWMFICIVYFQDFFFLNNWVDDGVIYLYGKDLERIRSGDSGKLVVLFWLW